MNKKNQLIVGILIFNDVEILDVAGPFEVFAVTRLNEEQRQIQPSPFKVLLIAENNKQIVAIGGLRLTPDVSISECPMLDLLIVPGGWGTRKESKNKILLNWIGNQFITSNSKLIASVCTGSSLLGKAGLLDGRDATTHWRAFDFLQESAPQARIIKKVRFTLTEPIFTAAGVSAGIDLALCIVSHFFGIEVGKSTARQMEYPYPDSDQRYF
ncbi:MAG TPA: DJ-1/PfpI family protein [Nitrososphaeraceae archaeon]|nr:DJ-1/PfpI family protein [Nitrososphaeraceae archaeon]